MTEQQNQAIQGSPETDELVAGLADVYNGVKGSLKDGKLDASDVSHFLPLLQSLPKAVEGISKVPAELKDLDSAEGAALLAKVAEKIGLGAEPAKVRLVVEGSFKVVEGGLKILEGVRS